MNLPDLSPDADRLWTDTEKTLRLLLARGGRLAAQTAQTAGRGRSPLLEEASGRIAPAGLSSQAGKRHERALRALAKEMKRLIIEDKRRGLGV